jgi:transposase
MKNGLTIETGPSIKRETTLKPFIGLDVSLKDPFISVREGGQRIWRGKCPFDPRLIAEAIRKRALHAQRVVFETGPLSAWFYHALTAEGLPAICIDARRARAALDMAPNKADANDADMLAHLTEVGFYHEVQVKGFDSMLVRTLVAARNQLLKMTSQRSNQIRGLMKTFGLVVSKGAGRVFDGEVRRLLASNAGLEQIILPVLEAWRGMPIRTAELSKQLAASAPVSEQCQLLCSIPGVGAVTASWFVAAIEDPENFREWQSVGAWIGLTTKRYQTVSWT